ncbi:MAG: sulfatase [Planctomycetota bacterium]
MPTDTTRIVLILSFWCLGFAGISSADHPNINAPKLFQTAAGPKEPTQPNFIIIFTDDQGYNDLGCFGSETIKTPNLDQLASQGRKYTSFYVPCSVCSPSRAALLTGCYPKRINMEKHVLFPKSNYGLHPDEYTIADHLKSQGYATACVGKWHLGHLPQLLPRANGFDSYYGIPYSNDMNHPDNSAKPKGVASDELWKDQESCLTRWKTPLYQDESIIELPVDQRTITRRYTDKAIKFVTDNQKQPFFLYLPHSMPHIPLYVPSDVYDPDAQNAYKCVIEHIDAEVGRLLTTLRDLNLMDRTYIIYTSDNGPWLPFKNHGGSAKPLRNGKGTTFEGGQRVPCIMAGPGIAAGTSTSAFTSTMDLLPTIASIIGKPLPDRKIDGFDITSTFTSDETPRDELIFYSSQGNLEGIRKGDWKYLAQKPRRRKNQKAKQPQVSTFLFNLANDIGEQNDLKSEHPEIVKRLIGRMIEADDEITANARPVWIHGDKKIR